MGILQELLRIKYNDEQLLRQTQGVIDRDPITNFPAPVHVSCHEGVITLCGQVNDQREKEHVEDVVRAALKGGRLTYKSIENELTVVEEL